MREKNQPSGWPGRYFEKERNPWKSHRHSQLFLQKNSLYGSKLRRMFSRTGIPFLSEKLF